MNRVLGDGLMAIFGAPLPLADHRKRAVRAALEMVDLANGFNREQVLRGRMEIRIGIGIASGPVVAGFIGTQQRVTHTCVSDTANLAGHLEAHTNVVGQPILIDENTRGGLWRGPPRGVPRGGAVQDEEPDRAGLLVARRPALLIGLKVSGEASTRAAAVAASSATREQHHHRLGWRDHHHPLDRPAEESAKVPAVTGNQGACPRTDRPAEDRRVLGR